MNQRTQHAVSLHQNLHVAEQWTALFHQRRLPGLLPPTDSTPRASRIDLWHMLIDQIERIFDQRFGQQRGLHHITHEQRIDAICEIRRFDRHFVDETSHLLKL